MKTQNPFRYFKTSPEIIHLAVMMYVRFPLSLRNAEDLLHERGIDVSLETIRVWWNRFGPMFASEIRRKRVRSSPNYSNWQWDVDEVFMKINGDTITCGALSIAYPFGAMSSTLRATTSHPRSLLSIARLNIARSRYFFANCNFVLIAHTCLGRIGGFRPVIFP